MVCEAGDVVLISWQSTGHSRAMPRPALVLSDRDFNEHGYTVLTMITDARHPQRPFDISIRAESVGLMMPSVVRMKLSTIENAQILKRLGDLSGTDKQRVWGSVRQLIR